MARDRIITWNQKAGNRPSAARITKAVKAFFGSGGPKVETDSDRLYIATSKEHWIEVALTPGVVDVITRLADSSTNQTAHRLAKTLAKTFNGDYEDPAFPDQLVDLDDDDILDGDEDDGGFV